MRIKKKRKTRLKKHLEHQAIVEDIEALNNKYIQLFINLKTHKTIVDENFYIAAQTALTEQYQAELELRRAEATHKTEERFYLANAKAEVLGIYTYRTWFKLQSSPMKQVLDERTAREADGYIAELFTGAEPPREEPEEETMTEEINPETCREEAPDSSEDTDMQEEPEEELELLVKSDIESDNLEELYLLEEPLDEDQDELTEESDQEQTESEQEQLDLLLALPEVADESETEPGDTDSSEAEED